VCRYHRILEIEDQGIGARLPAAVELALAVGGDEEQRAHSILHRPAFHQAEPATDRDSFAALIDAPMLELDDARVFARLTTPLRLHDRTYAQGIAMKYRFRKPHIGHAKIGDGGPKSRFTNTDADHQSESEQAIHQTLTELGLLGELLVEMKRLRIHRQRGEQHIVQFADGTTHRMFKDLAFFKFLEIQPGHRLLLLTSSPQRGNLQREFEGSLV